MYSRQNKLDSSLKSRAAFITARIETASLMLYTCIRLLKIEVWPSYCQRQTAVFGLRFHVTFFIHVLDCWRLRFGHLTVNGKPRFLVCGFTLPFCLRVGLSRVVARGCHVWFHSCGKSLTSRAWSTRTNVNYKPQTWRQGTSYVTSWRWRFAEITEQNRS